MSDTRRQDARHVWHPFTQMQTAPPPIAIASARGASLYTEDGREILDLISSWWVTLHGHAEPSIAEAIARQAGRLEQVIFAGFTHEPATSLAARLTAELPGDLNRVFFSDDGSTSVEVALKLALQFWRNRGEHRPRILALEGGYHGDTFGAMAAGASSGFFRAFDEHLFDVTHLPFPETWANDPDVERKEAEALAALDQALADHGSATAALIAEPLLQGASGMRMCRDEFVRAVSERLRAANVLLILDEVMTGFGRTGSTFACGRAGVTPDLICLSKGLTGGFVPMSVTVCRDGIYDAFLDSDFERAFAHGHSFTANPIGCAAALASLDLTLDPATQLRWGSIEGVHRERIAGLQDDVLHARICGTVAALDLPSEQSGYGAPEGPRLKEYFLEQGVLIRPLGNVIYLLPPYCVTDEQLHRGWDAVDGAVRRLGKESAR